MIDWIDNLSYSILLPITIIIGLAPFFPEPHLYEKLKMLKQGTLKKPLDIFDLLYHLTPLTILLIKVFRNFV